MSVQIQDNTDRRFLDSLHRKVRKAINDYGLTEEGDRILIGLSGGKDSLALTDFMAARQKIFSPHITVTAVHIKMTNIPYSADTGYLRKFAEDRGVSFTVRETSFDASSDRRKSPCFLCSWNRRKLLFDTAKELGCNKIALGHHQDDIIYTMLMNMFFQGSFSTMPPLLAMDRFDMKIIRPMAHIREDEIRKMSAICGYAGMDRRCPYEKESYRSRMQAIVESVEQMNPHARESIWNSMSNIQLQYLPVKKNGR